MSPQATRWPRWRRRFDRPRSSTCDAPPSTPSSAPQARRRRASPAFLRPPVSREPARPDSPWTAPLSSCFDECRGHLAVQPVGGQVLDEASPGAWVPVSCGARSPACTWLAPSRPRRGAMLSRSLRSELAVSPGPVKLPDIVPYAVVVQREPGLVVGHRPRPRGATRPRGHPPQQPSRSTSFEHTTGATRSRRRGIVSALSTRTRWTQHGASSVSSDAGSLRCASAITSAWRAEEIRPSPSAVRVVAHEGVEVTRQGNLPVGAASALLQVRERGRPRGCRGRATKPSRAPPPRQCQQSQLHRPDPPRPVPQASMAAGSCSSGQSLAAPGPPSASRSSSTHWTAPASSTTAGGSTAAGSSSRGVVVRPFYRRRCCFEEQPQVAPTR